MVLSLRRGTVTAIVERLEGLARIEVDGTPCIAYPRLTGPVEVDDEVLVNVQARELELGSGGFDVLYANLTRGLDLAHEPGAHVMKLPYTPLQAAVEHAEERDELAETLGRMPVVCCSLHSQVAPVCAGLGPGIRVAYLQLPGGALPVSLSDAVRALRERGLVEAAVAVGACVEGDVACVNVASALAWAAGRGFDVAVCSIGPGIVGTGTLLGHGGVAASEAANAAAALRGSPILADPREEVDVSGWEEACAGLPLSHMGRGPADDPAFFAAAFAAGRFARRKLGGGSAPSRYRSARREDRRPPRDQAR